MSYVEQLFDGASPANLDLAKGLVQETGAEDRDLWPWFARFYFNPNVETPEMSVRTVFREIVRKKIGYDSEARDQYPILESGNMEIRDLNDNQIKQAKFNDLPEYQLILSLIGKPVYEAYDWDRIHVWKLGSLESLEHFMRGQNYLALPETGVVLFSDEIKKLKSGKKLTTFHGAGIEGYLMESKEIYKVVNDELLRVIASFSD